MIKHLIFDAGGVLVYPKQGVWTLPLVAPEFAGERAETLDSPEFIAASNACAHWLSEAQIMTDIDEECRARRNYISDMNARMGWALSDESIDRLADDFTTGLDRYGAFNDALTWLPRWKGRYTLSALSDCLPSLPVYLDRLGFGDWLDGGTYSYQVGAMKPDPRLFRAALDALGAEASECLFVDDRAANARGAESVGLRAVFMVRDGIDAPTGAPWHGDVVNGFAALNRLLEGGVA